MKASISKRTGYFLKESLQDGKPGSGRYIIRYFIMDDSNNMWYTENFSQLSHIIKSSPKLKDLFKNSESQLKKIKVSEFKVSNIKSYQHPEILPFLNQAHFESTITLNNDNSDDNADHSNSREENQRKLLIFAFKDTHIGYLHAFFNSYGNVHQLDSEEELNEYIDSKYHKETLKSLKSQSNMASNDQDKVFAEKVEALVEFGKHINKIIKVVDSGDWKIIDEDDKQEVFPVEDNNININNNDHKASEEISNGDKDQTDAHLSQEEIKEKTTEPSENNNKLNTLSNQNDSTIKMKNSKTNKGGQPTKNIADGKGKAHYEDDISYVGDFRNGKRHGHGYFVNSDTSMLYVECINGKISGI